MFKEFEEYIEQAKPYIKNKRTHIGVHLDLGEWLYDYYEDFTAESMCHEDAIQAAIAKAGPPQESGQEWEREYYRTEHYWDIYLLLGVFLIAGLLLTGLGSGINLSSHFINPLLYLGSFLLGYRLDTRLLWKHSRLVYGCFVLLLAAAALLESAQVITGISGYLFLLFPLAFAGIMRDCVDKGIKGWVQCAALYALPAVPYGVWAGIGPQVPVLLATATVLYVGMNNGKMYTSEKSWKAEVVNGAFTAVMLAILLYGAAIHPGNQTTALLLVSNPYGILLLLVLLLCHGYVFYKLNIHNRAVHYRFGKMAVAASLLCVIVPALINLLGKLWNRLPLSFSDLPLLAQGLPAGISFFLIGVALGTIRDGSHFFDGYVFWSDIHDETDGS